MFTLTFSCALICGFAALAGGFIDAIAGGGGLLTIPALLLAGVPPHMALGTNKLGAFLGTSASLLKFSRNHLVNWRMVLHGFLFSITGSLLGSYTASCISADSLAKIIVGMLPFAMIATILPQKRKEGQNIQIAAWRISIALPLFCLLMGFYDGFFGPGAGTFLILGLYWFVRLPLLDSSATAKAFNLASNVSSAIYFTWKGMVHWELGLIMALCFIAGNWAGATFAIHSGSKAVRRFLLLSMSLLLLSLIWRFFLSPRG